MFNIKTLVEFFDDNQINNVVAALRLKPSKIVYVGYDAIMSPGRIAAIEKMFAMKKVQVEIELCEVDRYNFDDVVNKLEEIIANNEECCFDLTGGKELAIAAMGYLSGKHKMPMVQFNVRSGKIIKVKNCENIQELPEATLSVRESVVLGGGVVLENELGDTKWVFDDDFRRDVNTMWDICRESCALWNKQSNVFHSFEEWGRVSNLSVWVDINAMERRNAETMLHRDIIEPLCDNGILRDYSFRDGLLTFRYKNYQVKRCLNKAGNILELYSFLAAEEINRDEQGFFDDMDIGVHIDWDGDVSSAKSVKNEVDLMIMRGIVPVFVSCKNGEVHKEALYELSAVADEFGGEYAKKVLVATYISRDSESKKHFLRRAAEMNIKVIEDADTLNRREFIRELRSKTM